jgi:hypothetical protein
VTARRDDVLLGVVTALRDRGHVVLLGLAIRPERAAAVLAGVAMGRKEFLPLGPGQGADDGAPQGAELSLFLAAVLLTLWGLEVGAGFGPKLIAILLTVLFALNRKNWL